MGKVYTIQEVATILNLSDKTLRRWEEAGRFSPKRTLGNQRRYSVDDLQILDALKHGTIESQSELLSLNQAAEYAGVTTAAILRWESEGKLYPFVTDSHTYYPSPQLQSKLAVLKQSPPPLAPAPINDQPEVKTTAPRSHIFISPYLINAIITLVLLVGYHILFQPKVELSSPRSQNATESARLDILEGKVADLIQNQSRTRDNPANATVIK